MVGFNFAPAGWAFCQGQLLSIASNTALFALLGTTYGGNGVSTFALPNLSGRVPINFGQGLGLPNYALGQIGGQTSVNILPNNLPGHTHLVTPQVSGTSGTSSNPLGNYPAIDVTTTNSRDVSATTMSYAAQSAATQAGGSFQTGPAGGNIPLNIEPPYLVLNFIIALNGIFPSRS